MFVLLCKVFFFFFNYNELFLIFMFHLFPYIFGCNLIAHFCSLHIIVSCLVKVLWFCKTFPKSKQEILIMSKLFVEPFLVLYRLLSAFP